MRYNYSEFELTELSIIHLNLNCIYEIIELSEDVRIRMISINHNNEILNLLKIKRYNTIAFQNSIERHHYRLECKDFKNMWEIVELLNEKIQNSCNKNYNKIISEITHHSFFLLIYLWVEISNKYNTIELKDLNRSDQLTRQFIYLVSKHFRTERLINFYSEILTVSAKHLSETTKKSVGYTAKKIIDTAVLNEAKVMLSVPRATVKEVAHELNFSDQYSFSKFFKKHTGITPSVFIQKI